MSDDFEYDAPEDYSTGGDFLNVEGWFHCVVESIDKNPQNKNGELIPNAAMRVKFGILDGTAPGQFGKSAEEVFFHPSLDKDEKKQQFAKKKIGRMFAAIGLDDTAVGGAKKKVDLSLAPGRQFVCHIERGRDPKYVQIAFADIFHVDDPEVGHVPKNQEMLKDYKFRKPSANGSAGEKTDEYREPEKPKGDINLEDL